MGVESQAFKAVERTLSASNAPLFIAEGDHIGVVAMAVGGPENSAQVKGYLTDRMLVHASGNTDKPSFVKRWLSSLIATVTAPRIIREYEAIGGSEPDARHVRDQASALQQLLSSDTADNVTCDVRYSVYPAMQYGAMPFEDIVQSMKADGVTKVVLLPLYPQYDPALAGVLLRHWENLVQGEFDWARETTIVAGYARCIHFIQAISERIDEGLQRFPHHMRHRVNLVFSGLGIAGLEYDASAENCPMGGIVDAVMSYRTSNGVQQPYHLAYQRAIGWHRRLKPSMEDMLEQLVERGETAVLVVPIAQVSDRVETVYRLDIDLRQKGLEAGLEQYEVASCLNCHPLFVRSLSEAVRSKLTTNGKQAQQDISSARAA